MVTGEARPSTHIPLGAKGQAPPGSLEPLLRVGGRTWKRRVLQCFERAQEGEGAALVYIFLHTQLSVYTYFIGIYLC